MNAADRAVPRVLAMLLVMAAGLGMLGGCNEAPVGEQIAAARAQLERGESKAAVIQLKGVLDKEPQLGEARYLLGRALLDAGEAAAATVELERAHALAYDDDLVVPLLAKAVLGSGQARKVTTQFGQTRLGSSQAQAQLKVVVAVAHLALGQRGQFEEALNEALRADARNAEARLLAARQAISKGAVDDALEQARALQRDDPKRKDAWLLEGELLWQAKGDVAGAQKALEQAVAIDERYASAHAALAQMMLQERRIDDFKARVALMKKVLPADAQTRYYEAQAALLDKDYRAARALAQPLVQAFGRSPRALQLAAAIELADGAPVLAQTYLGRALEVAPNASSARRQLAEAHLQAGDPAKALSVLRPLLEVARPTPETMALAAQAHLQAGDAAKAQGLFERAVKAQPDAARLRAGLALAQISAGDSAAAGLAELESQAAGDASATYADLALISARMRRREIDQGLQAVDRLQAKMPDRALPQHLRGQLLSMRKDVAAARGSFERALQVEPSYFPAAAALARLDLAEGKPERARERYDAMLARDPNNPRVAVALAQLRYSAGDKPQQVTELLGAAIKAHPRDVGARVALIDYHLAMKDLKAAGDAAQAGLAALPDDPQLQQAMGRVQLASGDVQQAASTLGKAAMAQPSSVSAHLQLAEALLGVKDHEGAAKALRRVLEIDPRSMAAQRGLAVVALANKRPAEALKIAQQLQQRQPADAIGWQLQADVHATQREWAPAISAQRAANERSPSTDSTIRLHQLLLSAGRAAEAQALADAWLKAHPGDVKFMFHDGASHMLRRQHAAAEARFRQVLAARPDDATALNNVAWLMLQQGKPGALPLAERAQRLAEGQPQVMDTLAQALAAEGQWAKAVEWQRKAVAAAPDAPGFRLLLARLLVKAGDRPAARQELEALAKLGDGFAAQAEVTKLLQSL